MYVCSTHMNWTKGKKWMTEQNRIMFLTFEACYACDSTIKSKNISSKVDLAIYIYIYILSVVCDIK